MKVSLKWLNEYVEVPTDIKAFCDKLDLTGTGVQQRLNLIIHEPMSSTITPELLAGGVCGGLT